MLSPASRLLPFHCFIVHFQQPTRDILPTSSRLPSKKPSRILSSCPEEFIQHHSLIRYPNNVICDCKHPSHLATLLLITTASPLGTRRRKLIQYGVEEEGSSQGQLSCLVRYTHGSLISFHQIGHHPRRQWSRKDQFDEPICTPNNEILSYLASLSRATCPGQ